LLLWLSDYMPMVEGIVLRSWPPSLHLIKTYLPLKLIKTMAPGNTNF
jgi:hypothetical protein